LHENGIPYPVLKRPGERIWKTWLTSSLDHKEYHPHTIHRPMDWLKNSTGRGADLCDWDQLYVVLFAYISTKVWVFVKYIIPSCFQFNNIKWQQ
jgi:hypothetical protein